MTNTDTKTYSIKELADDFGVTARTLRHYEDEGLLFPERSGLNRIYSSADHARLAWILRGRRVGFSLSEIREMLDLYNLGDGREKQRQVTLERCRGRIDELKDQRDDIIATIAEMEEFCDTLDNLTYCSDQGRLVSPDTGLPPEIKVPSVVNRKIS